MYTLEIYLCLNTYLIETIQTILFYAHLQINCSERPPERKLFTQRQKKAISTLLGEYKVLSTVKECPILG